MRAFIITSLYLAATFFAFAQAPENPPVSEDKAPRVIETTVDVGKLLEERDARVVVVVDGKPITAKEFRDFLRAMPANVQQNFRLNPQAFLRQYAMLRHFEAMADESGLSSQYPHKQRLEYRRQLYLMEAQLQDFDQKVEVTEQERKAYFENHQNEFRKGYFKLIYFMLTPGSAGSADPKEEAVRSRARQAVEEARSGADFVELVRKYSEDSESKAKDGDFGPLTAVDPSVPPEILDAIFRLKPGEVSDPLRHDNGYYVFRAEKFEEPDYEKVRGQLGERIRRQKMDAWVRNQQNNIQIEIKDPSFFAPAEQPGNN